MSVTGKLYENCIWGDKSSVLLNPKSYPLLFKEYGTKFGGDGVNTFGIPNFSDCAIWANETPGQRLGAALPNINGQIKLAGIYAHSSISGVFNGSVNPTTGTGATHNSTKNNEQIQLLNFSAANSSSVYKNGTTTVYPNRMTVRVMIRYQ